MNLPLKENCAYAMVVPTSMGVRLTPADGQPTHVGTSYSMHATSAETNVATIASSLGLPVKVLTAFVEDSPIAELIKRDLRARGMTFEGRNVPQGGPWGYRHQFNIADSGSGPRGPRVHNDRAGEVGRTLCTSDFDLGRLFGDEGVQIVHMSGLIAALSPETGAFCLEIARAAKKYGTKISFDLNYRATFWEGREQELRTMFQEIASLADILEGNEEEYQLCLGIEGPEPDGKDLHSQVERFQGMVERVHASYPGVSVFATTLRQVIDANRHLWGCLMLEHGRWYVIEPKEITVLDRIGGGDGFVGGLLYGVLKGWKPERCLEFGWASGALAATFLTDYAVPADEDMVWSVWEGNARVRR